MIISDSSPLIHLTKIGKIKFIIDLFGSITITESVNDEVVKKGLSKGFSDAEIINSYIKNKKIKVESIPKKGDALNMQNALKNYLHKGELDSIILSNFEKGLLLIDERKGRLICEQHHIPTITTSSILLLLLKKNIINMNLYESNFSKYGKNGWISLDVYQKYIEYGRKTIKMKKEANK